MITEEEKIEIHNLIETFIQKMCSWEAFCRKVEEDKSLTFDEQFQKRKTECIKIFNEYCTNKERKYGRPTTISYGYEYNPQSESVVTVEINSKSKATIYTETADNGFPSKYQYGVIKKSGKWLLDTKKRYSNFKKKWVINSL